jgi:hypothetical protein
LPKSLKSIFVVAVKAGAGNFCSSKFGACHSESPSESNTRFSRNQPGRAESENQSSRGLAGHCHAKLSDRPSNSSPTCGTPLSAEPLPTFDAACSNTGCPVPSPSASSPITG